MKTNLANEYGKIGWILSLKNNPDSLWGSLYNFYDDIITGDGPWEEAETGYWPGKYFGDFPGPSRGDGIALFHNSRAEFVANDRFKRRPRISLIGIITGVEAEGHTVNYIKLHYNISAAKTLQISPIVRDDTTQYLFNGCGMTPARIATYYMAPPAIWINLVNILTAKMRQ